MKKVILFILLPLLFLTVASSFSQTAYGATNPFITTTHTEIAVETGHSNNFYSSILTTVTLLQKDIRAKLTGFARDIKKESFGTSFWLFLLFSFAYGVVHAIGPGHGKSVVCAYFLSRQGTLYTAAFMSWVITLVHVGSATITICLAYLLLSSRMSGFESFNYNLQTLSYGLIIFIGLWLFFGTVRSLFSNNREEVSAPNKCASLREITTVAFVTGIVPCPGAAIILVYTLSTEIIWAGLVAMLFLATGMALTTSLFAIAAAKTRSAMDHAAKGKRAKFIYTSLSLAGSTIIIIFGLLMLSSHLE
jgi:ABC-type nickel/cobalt efflux system permease component RcnA